MSRRLLGRARRVESEQESVWISFSDLMTALLTVFMLAAVALVFSLTQEQNALARAKAQADRATIEAERASARAKTFDRVLNDVGTSGHARSLMVEKIRRGLAARGIGVDVDPAN